MSVLNNERVTTLDDGTYEVQNASAGTLKVLPYAGGWAVYFGSATLTDRSPTHGLGGSFSDTAESAIEWALR